MRSLSPARGGGGHIAVAALRSLQYGGFLGLEKKFFDTFLIDRALTAPTDASGGRCDPASVDCLNAVAQGDGEQQRDGRQINMQSITIKGVLSFPPTGVTSTVRQAPSVFIALVMDVQTNGAPCISEDIWTNPSGDAELAASCFLNLENSQRFRVLKTVHLGPADFQMGPAFSGIQGAWGFCGMQVPWSMYVDLGGERVNFITSQSTSVIAAIADNSLHVIAYTNETDYAIQLQYNARLRFMG